MSGSGASIVVKRGDIEGHVRPPGGDFAQRAVIPRALTGVVSRFIGVHCVDTAERTLAITYDDGPHPMHTPRILDALTERGVKATFFVLTDPARRHPEIIRRIVADGHELALHGADHRSMLGMSDRDAAASVARARDDLEQLADTPIRLFRPPYGHHTLGQASRIRREGLELVIWSGDALDWIDDTEERVAERGWSAVFPGGILLLHDDRADPEMLGPGEALPAFDKSRVTGLILDRGAQEGYSFATVGELLDAHPHVLSASRERMRRR